MKNSIAVPHVPRNILSKKEFPRTKHATFFLLDHITGYLEKSGQKDCQIFDSPQETLATVRKAMIGVSKKWVRAKKTSTKDLQKFRRAKRHVRRVAYKESVQVFKKATVPALRQSLLKMHGQGFLRKCVAVHPYRPMDTFLGGHRVNVYRQGNRFDVIDALCNIPILAGLTKPGLKKFVAW